MTYPRWIYYPRSTEPAPWVEPLVEIFQKKAAVINGSKGHLTSNEVLTTIRPSLERLGYVVEGGKSSPTIQRPVHFGEHGRPDRTFQIDSYHPGQRIGLEVEAGRSTRGNAVYRDIIQTSLLVDVDYFALAVPQTYSFNASGRRVTDPTYEICMSIFDSIYSSDRLRLPLKGVLLVGY